MKKFLFHRAMAEQAMQDLHSAYMERRGLFQHVRAEHAPQNRFLPKDVGRRSLQHRLWLFFAVMTDRRQVSEEVYRSHVELHERHPALYNPQSVMELPEEELLEAISRHRIGLPNQSAGFWKRCAGTLHRHFQGDPLELFRFGSVDKLIEWKKAMERITGEDQLPGYGPKISSLLAIFLEEQGFPAVPDALPVDVHVQRFFLANNLVTLRTPVTNEDLEKLIRPFLTSLCADRGWNRLDLCHALWLLGNRVCSNCHRRADAELLCPAYASCKGAPATKSYFLDGQWNPKFRRMRKGGQREFKIQGPLFK